MFLFFARFIHKKNKIVFFFFCYNTMLAYAITRQTTTGDDTHSSPSSDFHFHHSSMSHKQTNSIKKSRTLNKLPSHIKDALEEWSVFGHNPTLDDDIRAELMKLPYRRSGGDPITIYRGLFWNAGDLYAERQSRGHMAVGKTYSITFGRPTSWTHDVEIARRFAYRGSIGMIVSCTLTQEQINTSVIVDFDVIPKMKGRDELGMQLHKERELILVKNIYTCVIVSVSVVSRYDVDITDEWSHLPDETELITIERRDRFHNNNEEYSEDEEDEEEDERRSER